jgi:hypothetical protein
MKTTRALSVISLTALLCAGCMGTGPSTQRGAVGGALAGAVAGGVIGNNHGSHNTWSGAAIGAAAGGVAGAALGNAADQRQGTIYNSPSPYDTANRYPAQPQYPAQAQYPATQGQYPAAPPQVQYPAQYEQPQTEYVVVQPPAYPPPPREVIPVRPAREAVWVQGYYLYTGRRSNAYQWVPGHWEVPPRGGYRTFVQPRWEHRGHNYVYVRGYWH